MTYEEFNEAVKKLVQARCEKGDEVQILQVMKNNSIVKEALSIRRSGQKIAPNIYLKRFYEEYEDGKSLEEIVEGIMYLEKNYVCPEHTGVEQFQNYSYMRKKIHGKLINTEQNRALLEKVPHREYMDLSIVYYVLLRNDEESMSSTIVHCNHMETWGVTEEELYEVAMENTFGNLGVEVHPITDYMYHMLPPDATPEMYEMIHQLEQYQDEKMYVVSNIHRVNGAITMLYGDFLKTFALEHGSFYIIPSSVHELIFVTRGSQPRGEELREMVSQVNATELAVEDILSDNVYYYDASENSLQYATFNQ